jgi:hypothetical protein
MAVAGIPVATPPAAALGLATCTALVIGNMVGSGFFIAPSALAQFGPISIGGWLVGAGADVVYYGFLLLLAGVPVFVGIKWRQPVKLASPQGQASG